MPICSICSRFTTNNSCGFCSQFHNKNDKIYVCSSCSLGDRAKKVINNISESLNSMFD